MIDRDHLRVSDADRQAAVERLRIAMGEGRLDLLEYDDRLAQAYRSVTYGDLDRLFVDLPFSGSPTAHDQYAAVAPGGARAAALRAGALPAVRHMPTALKVLWTIWAAVMAVNLTVWLLVDVGGGAVYFWPIWLLVPAAALFGVTASMQALRRPPEPRPPEARREFPPPP